MKNASQKIDRARRKELNKKLWFGVISTQEEAEYILNGVVYGFYFFALFQVLIGFFVRGSIATLVEMIIVVILAFCLQRTKKPVFAWALLAIIILETLATFYARATGTGGGNIFLAFVVLLLSVRSLYAANVLAKIKASLPITS